ncbi:hypothetical protein [Burkholderia vietnamiensis]|uniref:hypothetical protein n=1 Tax=Burkholderia vietnamiensis TaxID=60552 RepID=UPI001D1508B0|nr:hypothetical protein [Burkholderia vietnamiensis]UEC01647.1 hypothetical protein LK462_06375 [Burkholderia vietnamiensis]
MNGKTQQEPKPVRLVFELARADNPRLYDELARFPQGAKRVNRLRVLAYDGLLAQYGVFASVGATNVPGPTSSGPESVMAAVTNDVFAPGLAE